MIINKYHVAAVDLSYINSRNTFAASKGKEVGEYTEGDVLKITLQTLNKLRRDFGINADKIVFLSDTWDRTYNGYYRTWLLRDHVAYKGSRHYMTIDELEAMKRDPNTPAEAIKKAELELYQNQVKARAKKAMLTDFASIGLPCISVPGWEADDLCWLMAGLLYSSDKPSIVITKDGDWMYSLTPKLDYFKLPTSGSEPKIITYDEMYNSMPEEIKQSGIGLYKYHAMCDALGSGHNDMAGTKAYKFSNTLDAVLGILNDDYSAVGNRELYELQMKTFDLSQFPRLDEAKNLVMRQVENAGKIDVAQFKSFCAKYKIPYLNERFYTEFTSKFDQKLFSEV